MIARAHRFHGHGSLRYVYQHGRTVRTPMFSLAYSDNPKRDSYRAAVVVSKKISKSAVTRNRIRRRVFEALRLQEKELQGTFDMVFTIHNESVATMDSQQLHASIHKALLNAAILKK